MDGERGERERERERERMKERENERKSVYDSVSGRRVIGIRLITNMWKYIIIHANICILNMINFSTYNNKNKK